MSDVNMGTARGEIVIETSDLILVQRTLQQTGKALLGIGTVALAGFGIAVKAAADFEKELSAFKAVTDATSRDMDIIREKALQLGRDSAYGASQVAAAFRELGKAGATPREIIEGMGDAVVQLAAAGDLALQRASDIAVNVQQTFQLPASQMVKIVDALAGAANASTVEVEDLGVSLKYVGGVAAALGLSVEDTITALGILGRAGIRGSTAGTSLRRILVSLTPTSREARLEMEKLGLVTAGAGVTAKEHEAAAKKEASAVEKLAKANESLTQLQERQNAAAQDRAARGTDSGNIEREAAAQQRLADAEANLVRTREKLSSLKPATSTAQEVSRQQQLARAEERVAKANASLLKAQQTRTRGGTDTARQVRDAQALENAQRRVAEATGDLAGIQEVLAQPVSKNSSAFFDAQGNAKDLATIFQTLKDATKGLTREQALQSLETIFQNRAVASAIVLSRDGKKGFEDFARAMSRTTAAKIMEERLNNLSGSMRRFKAALETAFIAAGTQAQKPLKQLVDLLTRLVNAFSTLSPGVQQAIVWFVLAMGIFFATTGALALLLAQVVKAIRLFVAMAEIIQALKNVAVVARLFGVLGTALKGVAGAFGLLLTPVGLVIAIIAAIAAAFALAYFHIKPFREWVDKLWQSFQVGWDEVLGFFQKIPDYLSDAAGAAGRAVGDVINFFQAIPGAVGRFFGRLPGIIGRALASMIAAVAGFGAKVATAIGGGVVTAFRAFMDFMAALPYRVGFALGFVIGRIIRFGIDGALAFKNFAIAAGKAILDFLVNLPGQIAGLLTSAVGAIAGFIAAAAVEAARFGVEVGEKILGFFRDLPGNVASFLANVVTTLMEKIPEWGGAALQLGGEIVKKVIEGIGDIVAKVGEILSKVPGKVAEFIKAAGREAKKIGEAIYNGIKDAIKDLPGMVKGVLEDVLGGIGGFIGDIAGAAKDLGTGAVDGVRKGLEKESPSAIEEDFDEILTNVARSISKLATQVRKVDSMRPGSQMALATAPMTLSSLRTAPYEPAAPGGDTNIDFKVYYPPNIPTEESVTSTLQKAQYMGLLT